MNTKSYDSKKWMTISQCLSVSGYHNAYFRMKVLKAGKIEFKKEMIPGTQIPRILVDKASFENYLKGHPKGQKIVLTEEMKTVLREKGFKI